MTTYFLVQSCDQCHDMTNPITNSAKEPSTELFLDQYCDQCQAIAMTNPITNDAKKLVIVLVRVSYFHESNSVNSACVGRFILDHSSIFFSRLNFYSKYIIFFSPTPKESIPSERITTSKAYLRKVVVFIQTI